MSQRRQFLKAVDSVTSGYVPFQDFDLSTNFHEYLKLFDEILAYKFDNFIGGHLTDTGTRKDVEITKEYTNDVYQTVKRIHNGDGQVLARSIGIRVTARSLAPVGWRSEIAAWMDDGQLCFVDPVKHSSGRKRRRTCQWI